MGLLPNVLYIIRKPEPLGTEFKTVGCPETGMIVAIEIQHGKNGMKDQAYVSGLGVMAACTVHLAEVCCIDDGVKEVVNGDAWFGSVRFAVALGEHGKSAVLQIKTGHGLFPKKWVAYIFYSKGRLQMVFC